MLASSLETLYFGCHGLLAVVVIVILEKLDVGPTTNIMAFAGGSLDGGEEFEVKSKKQRQK